MVRLGRPARWLFYAAVALYVAVPMVAVLLYSFSARWTGSLLPDAYTLDHWRNGLADPRMQVAIWRTVWMGLLVLLLDILIVVPAVYWQRVRNPKIRVAAELAAAIPFVLPFVVIAFGILRLMGRTLPELFGMTWGVQLLGSPLIVLLGHAAIAFPFLYWAVDGAMAAADVVKLNEAAATCGATPLQTLRHVVAPNISAGLAAGGMLVFATSFGEFALVQILAGARFENVSLYSLNLLQNTTSQVEKLAVLTVVTFVVLFAISVAVVALNRGRAGGLLPGARALVAEKDA
jgi:putative spermidine/putrescine transport system permease protein